jgi:hypothetical protein
MQLARIITNSADDSLELSMQLRSRGYRVETVAPDQIPDTPADLEVRLEECASEDVLSRAAIVEENEDLWVFVAPGALEERARPIRTIPLVPQISDRRSIKVVMPPLSEIRRLGPPVEDLPVLAQLNEVKPALQESATLAMTPPIAASSESKVNNAGHELSLERVKVIAIKKVQEIPTVPERVVAQIPLEIVSVSSSPVLRKPLRISLQFGPKFWRIASVTSVLVMMGALVTIMLAVRPNLPASTAGARVQPTLLAPVQPLQSTVSQPVAPPPASSPSTSSHRAAASPKRRRSGSEDGLIAEDTVVFYDRKPALGPRKERAEVKRFSDAN